MRTTETCASGLAQAILLVGLLLFTVANALAQQTAPQNPSPSPTDDSGPVQPSPSPTPVDPKVTEVIGNLELDDIVEIRVQDLEKWDEQGEQNDASKLVPYINGRAMKGLYPEELHLPRGRLIYHLEITPENKEVWTDLLGAPQGIRRPVTISVGLENVAAFDSVHVTGNPVTLTIISPVYGILALLVTLLTLGLLIWLAKKTNIIREPGPPAAPGKRRPYNLGRAQMAFWFFLIHASYVTIWLITDALDTITASLLALMGISAGTALSEALIDNGKDTVRENQMQSLSSEKLALEQSISETQPQMDAINAAATTSVTDQSNREAMNQQLIDSRTRLGQVDQQLRVLDAQSAPTVSGGFLRDILSDGSGYSFHRFQIFAWTIVLGIIFVSSVYNNLTMPEFSPTLLGLMGLSAGTYIGFKFPEQK
jgi:hypothetical protein